MTMDYWKLAMVVLPMIPLAQLAFSGKPGSGAAKKELVMGATQGLLGLLEDGTVVSPERRLHLEASLSSLIETVVSAVNAEQAKLNAGA